MAQKGTACHQGDLEVDPACILLLTVGAFLLTVELLCLQSAQVLSSIVSKKARIVSEKAPKHTCKQKAQL